MLSSFLSHHYTFLSPILSLLFVIFSRLTLHHYHLFHLIFFLPSIFSFFFLKSSLSCSLPSLYCPSLFDYSSVALSPILQAFLCTLIPSVCAVSQATKEPAISQAASQPGSHWFHYHNMIHYVCGILTFNLTSHRSVVLCRGTSCSSTRCFHPRIKYQLISGGGAKCQRPLYNYV